ncbi:MAG: hypothetical protein ACFFC7_13485 [Candidatus Hermodarchaeota archaeon]
MNYIVNHPSFKGGACRAICKGNRLISLREVGPPGSTASKLLVEFQNAPWGTPLASSSASGWLNREETLSAPTKYWRVT